MTIEPAASSQGDVATIHMATTPMARATEVRKGRCIALYPGAFRPPHKVHLAAIVDLASRIDVDEVVVVISNRCRYIPGTTQALDAHVARRVLEIYLQDVPKARVEIATHNAVTHTLGYLQEAVSGDRLLFCVGEADLANGDTRFEDLISLHKRADVTAEVLPLPTGLHKVRATALRQALAAGDMGHAAFMAALPENLSADQRARVWSICRDGMREMNDIVASKVRTLLTRNRVGDYDDLRCVVPGKIDPVLRLRRADGRRLFVKYSGDTAESGTLGQPLKPKPRRRLATERRAIKCLRANLRIAVELAEIVCFDKASSMLVLSEVCPQGMPLQTHLTAGLFDKDIAAKLGQFLAECHNMSEVVPALWGEAETDLQHWRAMLALRTLETESARFSTLFPRLQADLQRLGLASDAARRKGFFVLDCCPKNILVDQQKIGVIDLELCSSLGDPAYDLGLVLGHYVLWGLRTDSGHACQAALRAALAAYQRESRAEWPTIGSRSAAFAGANILYRVVYEQRTNVRHSEVRLLATAASLLSQGLDRGVDAGQLLADAVAGRLA